MLPGVQVRGATEKDLPALLSLLDRYFAEGDVQHRDNGATVLQQVQAPRLGWYVAETHGELVGCVRGRLLENVDSAAECKRLYVSREQRGLGVGGALMDALEAAARNEQLAWMYLDSKDSFAVAMAMYARRGYTEYPRFNRNPEATFFFRKRLG